MTIRFAACAALAAAVFAAPAAAQRAAPLIPDLLAEGFQIVGVTSADEKGLSVAMQKGNEAYLCGLTLDDNGVPRILGVCIQLHREAAPAEAAMEADDAEEAEASEEPKAE